MADFEKAIPFVLHWEGGLVDDPIDPGGLTNRGITFYVFAKVSKLLLSLEPTRENLKLLTEEQAKIIYRKHFWDAIFGDSINSQSVANLIFDSYVNMGTNGIKITQRAANTKDDGIIGSNSLQAINEAEPQHLFNTIKIARIHYYEDLAERKPALQKFLHGWLNRISSLNFND